MTPYEYVLWLSGMIDAVGDEPTSSQWQTIKEKNLEVLSQLACAQLCGDTQLAQKTTHVPFQGSLFPPSGSGSLNKLTTPF